TLPRQPQGVGPRPEEFLRSRLRIDLLIDPILRAHPLSPLRRQPSAGASPRGRCRVGARGLARSRSSPRRATRPWSGLPAASSGPGDSRVPPWVVDSHHFSRGVRPPIVNRGPARCDLWGQQLAPPAPLTSSPPAVRSSSSSESRVVLRGSTRYRT